MARTSVTLCSTPLYSNTTLVSFIPTLAWGGTVVLLPKFDTGAWLRAAEAHRVTHAMLVPVQYRRLLADPGLDGTDLSSLQAKFCTSAPFAAELKAEVLRRMPGGLIEFFGMTEGGVGFMLVAHENPDKLHTVGQPQPGHAVRIIDEAGNDVPPGTPGEIVGQSPATMNGYKNRPDLTEKAYWKAPDGSMWLRTGDIGRLDRGRLPDADGPRQGHDHLGRLQHLSERSRGGAAGAAGGEGGRGRRRGVRPLGRDAGGVRGRARRRCRGHPRRSQCRSSARPSGWRPWC